MASRHLSLRLDPATFERLEAQSRLTGQTRTEIAKTLLEEGLRREGHPQIMFRSGPTGRRPGLIGGPDVWEVARVLRDVAARGGAVLEETVELTGLRRDQIEAVAQYYAEYRDEIDDWIQRVDEYADRAEATWRRGQELLRR